MLIRITELYTNRVTQIRHGDDLELGISKNAKESVCSANRLNTVISL